MINAVNTERWAALICIGAGGILCVGLLLEFALGLDPCPLCMMQRIWFALTGIVALIGLAHNPRWGIYPLVSALCAVVGGGMGAGDRPSRRQCLQCCRSRCLHRFPSRPAGR